MEKIKRKPIRRQTRWAKKRKSRREDILSRLRFKRKPGVDGTIHHISKILPDVISIIDEHLRDGGGR